MREILFRGQHRRKGEKVRMGDGEPLPSVWVYGGVLQGPGDFSIIYGGKNPHNISEGLNKWPVYTDTVGQYTGLKDRNGKRIFEGDIVTGLYDYLRPGVVTYGRGTYDSGIYVYQGWYVQRKGHNQDHCSLGDIGSDPWSGWVVVGNIHDNPELLDEVIRLEEDKA